ncbi:MAG: 3D domain-containing protein [Bdellovibrio sp.]
MNSWLYRIKGTSFVLLFCLLGACGGSNAALYEGISSSYSVASGDGVTESSSSVDEDETAPPPVLTPEENEGSQVEEPETLETPELVGPGVLKPTVYYFVIKDEDKKPCDEDEKTSLIDAQGKKLLTVCRETLDACLMQGSCGVKQKGKTQTFNVMGRYEGQDRFFRIDQEECRFGYGVRSSCLEPFYTLAADLSIYTPGEVIYIPAVVGLELPDGSKHDGYFVIRDKGRGIKGRGRFDFFTGHYSWNSSKNPFKQLGLGSVKTNIPYFRVRGEVAKKVLERRAYPTLPKGAW